jgi:hypothetical protein
VTNKSISITSAMLITLSLPLAHTGVGMPGTITVADLAKETLARKTLKRAQASAAAAADEADQLRRIANSMSSPDSHLDKLTALKAEVNRMGHEIDILRAERESLAPWEEQAVDEVLPLLHATAANTESAIGYFNGNRNRLWTETYRDYADRVWKDSDQMAKILKNYLKSDRLSEQQVYVGNAFRLLPADGTRYGLGISENSFQIVLSPSLPQLVVEDLDGYCPELVLLGWN